MPLGLSNLESSFCHLMEMCLGDQQFVTFCCTLMIDSSFATNVNEMLGLIEMVFMRPKDFNLKINPKKCHFFQHSVVFLGYVLSVNGISANPGEVGKVQNWHVPSNQKELHSFLGFAFYYRHFIPKFAVISKCLHELVGPTHIKKEGKPRQIQAKIVTFNGQINTKRSLIF